MPVISASLVMQLRERTGAGMMECKKFLTATDGDIEAAVLEMRKAGQAKADKKADRVAAEGRIVIAASADMHSAVILEVNSETDFVARDEHFIQFCDKVGAIALVSGTIVPDELKERSISFEEGTIEEARQTLVAKIGENIKIRRIEKLTCKEGVVGHYLHGTRIGVLVAVKNGNEELAKSLAMHIAASKPLVVNEEQVSPEVIEHERTIFKAQAHESGKPQEIIDKMIEGRIQKFMEEVSLLGQPYIKDPTKKIMQLLKEHNAEVMAFIRFEVGEGIEKQTANFVEEVMSQVRES